MNTGIQDAVVLADALEQVLAGAPDSLLDRYGDDRRAVAQQVLSLTGRLTRMATLPPVHGPRATSRCSVQPGPGDSPPIGVAAQRAGRPVRTTVMDLHGRTFVITGANSGLGAVTARALPAQRAGHHRVP